MGKREKVSVESLGNPIALGRTAEVYAWDTGYVLKLFHEWFPSDAIKHEARITGAVHKTGYPVPTVGEIVEVDGRYGLVYERVIGSSMMDNLRSKPWTVVQSAHDLAELQAGIHTVEEVRDLPSQHGRLREKIQTAENLPIDIRERILKALGKLPKGYRLCHGDFHPGNILMTGERRVVIDWIDATHGNPLADVARSSIIIKGPSTIDNISSLLTKALIRIFHVIYINHYFNICLSAKHEYRRWLPIVAAARLSENISGIENWLVKEAQKIE